MSDTQDLDSNTAVVGAVDYGYDIIDLWKLVCSALIFLGLIGLTLMESGYTRKNFSVTMLLKNYFMLAVGCVSWYLIGFAFALGENTSEFIGEDNFGGEDWEVEREFSKAVFYGMRGMLGLFIINLAIPERVNFWIYPFFSAFYMIWVYPVIVSWKGPNGWLQERFDDRFVDFGGSTHVHILAGGVALGLIILCGKRHDWSDYHPNKRPFFEGINYPFIVVGGLLFILGLIGSNMGTAHLMAEAAQSYFNSMLAGSSCAVTTVLLMSIWNKDNEKYYFGLLNGFIAGVVSVSGMSRNVEPYDAFSMGIINAPVFVGFMYLVTFCKGDDAGAVVATHFISGMWGTFLTGFFDNDFGVWHGGDGNTLGSQVVAIVVIAPWAVFWSLVFFGLFRVCKLLRIPKGVQKKALKDVEIDCCLFMFKRAARTSGAEVKTEDRNTFPTKQYS